MATTNKSNMDTMLEQMNSLVATAGGKRNNYKENMPPARNSTPANDGTKKPKHKKNSAQTAKLLLITAQTSVMSWRQTKTYATPYGSLLTRWFDMSRGPSK